MENLSFYKIHFEHPNYSPLDPMPIGMDKRYIKAKSAEDALLMFKTNFPNFKDQKILEVKDTGCLSLEELAKEDIYFNPKINDRKF
jgi:hypothetical protein